MKLQPSDFNLKPLKIPVETFFDKVVMVRDRLIGLEQNVNSHKSLSDEEKVNLQQYMNRCPGSMIIFRLCWHSMKITWRVGLSN